MSAFLNSSEGLGSELRTADKRSKLTAELSPLKAADWDRLIPCHGDVIESGAKEIWLKVFDQFV